MHSSWNKKLPRRKLLIYQLKIHTRWKSVTHCNLVTLVFFLIIYNLPISLIIAGPAKLVLYEGVKKLEVTSKQCKAGVYLKSASTYTCSCITGVWGFYSKYCEKPITIAGGDTYCFRMKNHSISQIVSFGNPTYPFEASISIFKKDFFKLSNFYTDDNTTRSDPSSSFLTITDTSWTIYDETGDALCLKATTTGKRKFCLFGDGINPKSTTKKRWKAITKVKKGCLSKNVRRADSCTDILPPNDSQDCSLDLLEDELQMGNDIESPIIEPPSDNTTTTENPISSTTDSSDNLPDGWIRIKPIRYSTTKKPSNNSIITPKIPSGWIQIRPKKYKKTKPSDDDDDDTEISTTTEDPSNEIPEGWIKIKPKKYKTTPMTTTEDPDASSSKEDPILYSSSGSSSSSEEWIPIRGPTTTSKPTSSSTTTEFSEIITSTKAPKNICDEELTRDKVKEYWLDPENNACSKSINEAVFTDQLRRFTVQQFDKVFQSRLKSLSQMEQMLNYTKLIMQKTCQEIYVPGEFFQTALNAFMMFIHEDFFYGVEGAIPDVYPRIIDSLQTCLDKVQPHVFETEQLECNIKKITGWMILPGKRQKLEVSDRNSYKNFEILIETTWKMFLNTHSICFPDFKFSNDHHHFSVLIMELFSNSIYEKWIEPLDSKDLYSFILPNFNFLKETMQNIDYCVAATNEVSPCPAWMHRSGDPSKSTTIRKKRSIWIDPESSHKKKSEVWNGEAFCLQKMEDPELHLGFKKCSAIK